MKHPILIMNHIRAKIWKEQALDQDFMNQLDHLASIYAARKREEHYAKTKEDKLPDYMILFKDYKEWMKNNG